MSPTQTSPLQNQDSQTETRPPIVVVMGHVDHGKTTLIDYIRKSKIAEKEAGGITQHVGAYEVTHQGKPITVIDTPGHEAFSHMRSRGARVADIAILVIAADDGVQPQTKEAIDHIHAAQIPFLVALNKIDRPNANVEKIRSQLAELNVLLESWGGDVPSVEISAKTGIGIDALLDLVLLLREMNPSPTNPTGPGKGVIIESRRDAHRGPNITALILDGAVRVGDHIVVGKEYGKIKSLLNFLGTSIPKAHASQPVVIFGFGGTVHVGAPWQIAHSPKEAEHLASEGEESLATSRTVSSPKEGGEKKILRLVLKTDVYGSKEALESMLSKFNYEGVGIEIIRSEIGDIGEEDLKLAKTTGARVFGFKVKFLPQIETSSKMLGVDVVIKDIIYELVDTIRDTMALLLTPTIEREDLGEALVVATFGKAKESFIIGGKVVRGKIMRGASAEIIREGKTVGIGTIRGLQSQKQERDEVPEGREFGILFNGTAKIQERDTLRVYTEKKIPPKLQ